MSPNELLRLFQNEIYRNVAEPTTMQSYGTANLEVSKVAVERIGRALQVQLVTMLTPYLLRISLETYRTTLTVRMQIRGVQGRVLGEYEGQGSSQARVAQYYGFSQRLAASVSNTLALRTALAQIRQQINAKAPRLPPLLVAM